MGEKLTDDELAKAVNRLFLRDSFAKMIRGGVNLPQRQEKATRKRRRPSRTLLLAKDSKDHG